jgi:hypothetical protein
MNRGYTENESMNGGRIQDKLMIHRKRMHEWRTNRGYAENEWMHGGGIEGD